MNYFGGSALNVACSLAILGKQSHLSTIVGADHEGKEIISFLNAKSVITDSVEVSGQTNQSFIIVYNSDRTILSHHEKRNYTRMKITESEILYFASAGTGSGSLIEKIKRSVDAGAKLVFNPGSFEISSFDTFKSLLGIATLFIINRDEARQIIADTHEVKVQLDKILRLGAKVAVITDGANGVYFGTSEGHFHMHAAPANVKDPTGAGDAFASALVAGLMSGKSLEEASKWGMVNSASVIGEYGANTELIDIAQIDKLAQSNKILKFSRV